MSRAAVILLIVLLGGCAGRHDDGAGDIWKGYGCVQKRNCR